MDDDDADDDDEVKKAFGETPRLDDDTRLEALRGLERKMMILSDDDVGCDDNVERHLERRLKEDDDDDDFPGQKSAGIYATVVAMASRRPRLKRAAEEAYERTVVNPTRTFCNSRENPIG